MPINIDDLQIVNYCHPNCTPFKNIVRLPEKEAYSLAGKLAMENPETTAFYRFADFINYYDLRMKQDAYLYKMFISLGGKPQEKHPLSFVLQGSEFLNKWFDEGINTKIPLNIIPEEYISFTLGDSGAVFQRTGTVTLYIKERLYDIIRQYKGSIDEFMKEIVERHYYIEVQVWNDDNCIVN
jgi:hypothetical protein